MKKTLIAMLVFSLLIGSVIIGLPGSADARTSLRTGESLRRGEALFSPDGQFMLLMQDDGNLVVYRLRPVWSTNTNGTNADRLDLQGDGNLVLYGRGGRPVWDSGTGFFRDRGDGRFGNDRDRFGGGPRPNRGPHLQLQMQDDGNLVIYQGRRPIWSSRYGKQER